VRTPRLLGTLLLLASRRSPRPRHHQRKHPRHNYRHEVASLLTADSYPQRSSACNP
jgi:hypothetical protein